MFTHAFGDASLLMLPLAMASPLESYAAELEPHSGRHLGAFPQAFTHLALINAVIHVIRTEDAQDGTVMDSYGNPVPCETLSGHPESDTLHHL